MLVPSGEASSSKGPKLIDEKKDEVVVVWSPDVPVPDGHVVLYPVLDNAEDWDMIRYEQSSQLSQALRC